MAKKKLTATEQAAHLQRLNQARLLLEKAGFVPGPGDTWTPSSMGKRGGKARAKRLSKEQLSEIGKKGAAKRWATKPRKGDSR
jgi:hypothetical protein